MTLLKIFFALLAISAATYYKGLSTPKKRSRWPLDDGDDFDFG